MALLSLSLLFSAAAAGQTVVESTNFDGDVWVKRKQELRIEVSETPDPDEGVLHVFIGLLDVTSALRTEGTELVYDASRIPLESGESEVVVFLAPADGEWVELDRRPIRVLTRGGFSVAEFDPRLTVAFESQLAKEDDGVTAPDPQNWAAGNMELGATGRLAWKQLDVLADMNIFGTTEREEALRFGTEGRNAPYVDVSDYLLTAALYDGEFSLGHVTYGNQRHLVDNVNSRGITGRYQLHERVDVSGALLHGQTIVGWSNFSGLSNVRDNSIGAGTLGINLLNSEKHRARIEGSYMTGSLRPETSFNTGQITDAERSSGWAARLDAALFSDRVRFGGSFARSSFENPTGEDPQLTSGLPVVGVKKETGNAFFAEVAGDVLRDLPLFGDHTANITIYGNHETVEPLFKTLGAFTNTNTRTWVSGLNGDLAGVAFAYEYQNNRDNLDDLVNILTTRGRSHVATVSVPVASLVNPEVPPWWLPVLSYTYSWLHQFGENAPTFLTSGFMSSNIPNQVNSQHLLSSDWFSDLWSASYTLAHSFQDDQRSGVPSDDIWNTSHNLNVSLLPCAMASVEICEELALNLGGLLTRQRVSVEGITRRSRTGFGSLDWTFWSDLSLTSNFSYTNEIDSNNTLTRHAYTLGTGLAWQAEVPVPHFDSRPVRLFTQWNRQVEKVRDNQIGSSQNLQSWTVVFGISVAVF